MHMVGLASLWAAAALTLVTGYDYLRIGLSTWIEPDASATNRFSQSH